MKCQGVINAIKDCPNTAKWEATGFSAQFGVPSTDYVCDSCKKYMEENYSPKIMEYNRFPLEFRRLEDNNHHTINKWWEAQMQFDAPLNKHFLHIQSEKTAICFDRDSCIKLREVLNLFLGDQFRVINSTSKWKFWDSFRKTVNQLLDLSVDHKSPNRSIGYERLLIRFMERLPSGDYSKIREEWNNKS